MEKPGYGTIVNVGEIKSCTTENVGSSAADASNVDTSGHGVVVRLCRASGTVRFSTGGDATNADPTPKIEAGEERETFVPQGASLSLITTTSATVDVEVMD